jgi:putative transcriptional regulator
MGATPVRMVMIDGKLVEMLPDGENRRADVPPLRAMTETEIEQAASADPDNPPLTEEQLQTMKRRPRAFIIRRALDLTQEEFANRFGIPLGTLRDWEQCRTEPDATAKAYLKVIALEPETVAGALVRKTAA